MARNCLSCGSDISNRASNSKRCVPCQKDYTMACEKLRNASKPKADASTRVRSEIYAPTPTQHATRPQAARGFMCKPKSGYMVDGKWMYSYEIC